MTSPYFMSETDRFGNFDKNKCGPNTEVISHASQLKKDFHLNKIKKWV